MMLSLADIRDWIKNYAGAEHCYIGKLDRKQNRSVGVYGRNEYTSPRTSLGGLTCTSYDCKRVSVLMHWNENARETEHAAAQLFEQLRQVTDTEISGTRIPIVQLDTAEAVDVGTDENGVYERVIWMTFYYERKQ